MEEFMTSASEMWDKFATGGASAIQSIVFNLSGYEMSEFWALVILLGSFASLFIWLILRLKRPKKIHYLMEGGHRYYRP
ncbi:MAG: hypothetical protein COB08_015925 [Rhodobacteraceae bacterium]|nr:hypothetical protein [Paracoccaceae bacterium]